MVKALSDTQLKSAVYFLLCYSCFLLQAKPCNFHFCFGTSSFEDFPPIQTSAILMTRKRLPTTFLMIESNRINVEILALSKSLLSNIQNVLEASVPILKKGGTP